jgi:asparagine synthase (glutamine-hydrolysing)
MPSEPPLALAGTWRAGTAARTRLAALAAPLVAEGALMVAGAASSARSGDVLAIVAGRFSDHRRLAARVPGLDGGPAARTLAQAYASLGFDALALTRGEWTGLIWDPRRDELTLATDALGGRSLHWARSGAGLVFGEDVRDVLNLLPSTPAPDRTAVSSWLAYTMTPEEGTLYEGIYRLQPGTALRLSAESMTTTTFWAPRYRGWPAGTAEAPADRLRAELDAAVARATGDAERPAVLLSGGLDSASVAAAMCAHDRRATPVAYSATFPEHPEADESRLIDGITTQLDIPAVRSAVRGGRPIGGGLRFLDAWRVPSTSPNTFLWTPILAAAARDGRDVILDGQGGDELFDSMPFYLFADLAARLRLRTAWSLTRRYPSVSSATSRRRRAYILGYFAARGLAPRRLLRRRAHRGDQLLKPAAAREAGDVFDPWAWRELDGPRWWRYRAHATTHLGQLLEAAGTLRRRAALVPIADRHPLMLDQDLVELALCLPPELSFDARFTRPLARLSQAGRVPDSVRLRAGKSHFSGVLSASLGHDAELIATLLEPGDAGVREYVDSAQLDRLVSSQDMSLLRLTAIECWLRQLETPTFARDLAELHDGAWLDHDLQRDST